MPIVCAIECARPVGNVVYAVWWRLLHFCTVIFDVKECRIVRMRTQRALDEDVSWQRIDVVTAKRTYKFGGVVFHDSR